MENTTNHPWSDFWVFRSRKLQAFFDHVFINPVLYIFIYCVQERTSEDSKEAESFQQLLTARIQEFVEEVRHCVCPDSTNRQNLLTDLSAFLLILLGRI